MPQRAGCLSEGLSEGKREGKSESVGVKYLAGHCCFPRKTFQEVFPGMSVVSLRFQLSFLSTVLGLREIPALQA